MPIEIEFAVGFTFGVVLGAVVGLVRPLTVLFLFGVVATALIILVESGVPGLIGRFGYLVRQLMAFTPFFAGVGLGKILGLALSPRRA